MNRWTVTVLLIAVGTAAMIARMLGGRLKEQALPLHYRYHEQINYFHGAKYGCDLYRVGRWNVPRHDDAYYVVCVGRDGSASVAALDVRAASDGGRGFVYEPHP